MAIIKLISGPRARRLIFSGLLLFLAMPASGGAVPVAEVSLEYQALNLRAILSVSQEAEPGRVILMVHGTLAHAGMEIMQTFQARLSELGLSSLAITLSLGLDKRTGMFACDQPHKHRHTDALEEIEAWYGWLEGRGYSRISLLGHSRGGNQATLFAQAARAHAPEALILIAPMTFDADDLASNYLRDTGDSLTKLVAEAEKSGASACRKSLMKVPAFLHCRESQVSPRTFLSYYAPDYQADTPTLLQDIAVPVLLVLGSEDPLSSGVSQRLPQRPGIAVFEIQGADHFFRDLYADEAAEAIAEFLENLPEAS